MKRYKVIVVGMGKRGMHHAAAFHANPRFEVAGICDIDQKRLAAAAPKIGQSANQHRCPRAGQGRQAGYFLFLHAAQSAPAD